MDISASEWSSGCESGWTVYFDESSQSPYQGSARSNLDNHQSYKNADYEEDLSMVSDASSGPPQFQYGIGEEDEVECNQEPRFYYPSSSSSEKSKKKKAKEPRIKNQHSFLDDTASSPAFNYPNRITDPSNNQPSKEHAFGFKGNSAFGNQFGLWQSSNPRQQDSSERSRSRGRRRG